MTPLEKGQGCKLPINQRLLRGPLFCLVFANVYETERIKHAPRGVACVYLGYDPRNKKCFRWGLMLKPTYLRAAFLVVGFYGLSVTSQDQPTR